MIENEQLMILFGRLMIEKARLMNLFEQLMIEKMQLMIFTPKSLHWQ